MSARAIGLFCVILILVHPLSASAEPGEYEIPFRMEINLIVIDVTVNGKGPVKCALDTGADYNQLLPDAAKRVGLVDNSFKDLAEPTGSLAVGRLSSDKEEFRVELYPALVNTYKLAKIEGTVGFPFIRKYRVTLDYRNKKVVLRGYHDEKAFPILKELTKRKEGVKKLFSEKKYREAAEELEKIFAAAPKGSALGYDAMFNAARAHAGMKDPAKAAQALKRMIKEGYSVARKVKDDPAFGKIKDSAEFKEALNAEKPDPKRVPFVNDRYHVVFQGFINGKGPFRILMDSGSSVVVILPESAQKAGLAGGKAQSLTLGALEASNVEMTTSSPTIPLLREFGADVLLGTPFLSRYRVTIDFMNEDVTFDNP